MHMLTWEEHYHINAEIVQIESPYQRKDPCMAPPIFVVVNQRVRRYFFGIIQVVVFPSELMVSIVFIMWEHIQPESNKSHVQA
ncbi:hypothetical protein LINPERHAP1_LOCUS40298 [Linum perenne]